MRWFKHDTDADESEGLSMLIEKHGWEGYGRWFRMLETVAKKMDHSDRCSVTYPVKQWQKILGTYHRTLLEDYLQSLLDLRLIFVESKDNLITISIPNLLKKRDEYSQKSRQTPENVIPKNTDTDTDTDIRYKNKEDIVVSPLKTAKPKRVKLTDEQWWKTIYEDPDYSHIDLVLQNKLMDKWLLDNPDRTKSRKFIRNWLNKLIPVKPPKQQSFDASGRILQVLK